VDKGKIVVLLILVINLLISGNASFGSPISNCGPITSPGVYELNSNISNALDCILIASNDVTLDGQDYSIIGTGNTGFGIQVHNSSMILTNITLTNLIISILIKLELLSWNPTTTKSLTVILATMLNTVSEFLPPARTTRLNVTL
jgi:hypothetical protein